MNNRRLRERLALAQEREGFALHFPEFELCTDNGAMIALVGALRLAASAAPATGPLSFEVRPRWPFEELAAVSGAAAP